MAGQRRNRSAKHDCELLLLAKTERPSSGFTLFVILCSSHLHLAHSNNNLIHRTAAANRFQLETLPAASGDGGGYPR